MTTHSVALSRSSGDLWSIGVLRFFAAAVLVWVVGSTLAVLAGGSHAAPISTGTLVLAACLYAFSHLFRIARLALLVGNARLSLRRLAALHLFSSGVALGTPWRLGDLYRAIELGRTLHRVPVGPMLETPPALSLGLTFVWVERLLDAALLVPVLVVLLVWRATEQPYRNFADTTAVTVVTFLFVVASVLIVALLPENLRRVGTYLIRRHEAPWTVPVLRGIDDVRAAMKRVPAMLEGRIASLVAMSLLIWFFEVASVAAVLPAFEREINPVQGLLGFLSQSTAGNTLQHLLPIAPRATFVYLLATQVPLAIVALLAGAHYLRSAARARST